MLRNTILFIIIALIAGFLGFGGIAGIAATIAQVCFIIFVVLAILSIFRGARIQIQLKSRFEEKFGCFIEKHPNFFKTKKSKSVNCFLFFRRELASIKKCSNVQKDPQLRSRVFFALQVTQESKSQTPFLRPLSTKPKLYLQDAPLIF